MQNFDRSDSRYKQGALIVCLCAALAGCGGAQTTVAELPLPSAPDWLMTPPKPPPRLEEREFTAVELANAYTRLQISYIGETNRYRLLQVYVRRLHESRKKK